MVCNCTHDRIDQKIKEIEQEHGIQSRWSDNCPEYIATKTLINSKEKQKLKLKMRNLAKERWYLLKLKAKYAGLNVHVEYFVYHACCMHQDSR